VKRELTKNNRKDRNPKRKDVQRLWTERVFLLDFWGKKSLSSFFLADHELTSRLLIRNRPNQRKVYYEGAGAEADVSAAGLGRHDDVVGFYVSGELVLSVEVVKSLCHIGKDKLTDFLILR